MARPSRAELRAWWHQAVLPALKTKKTELVAGGMTEAQAKKVISLVCVQLTRQAKGQL